MAGPQPAPHDVVCRYENQGSDEVGRFDEQNRQAANAWDRLHALRTDSYSATDYVVVAE
ncbi:MAG TPA: hypothetical protein VHR39_15560 [Propionibacteriaceae bacterium]|nr:hypothetical protein [Propionibacteriaceae bacterium]HEX3301929.1 hypothetical protein [Thermomicrobiales bacterium]